MLAPHPEYEITIENVDIPDLDIFKPIPISSFFQGEIESGVRVYSMDADDQFNLAYQIECKSGGISRKCFATHYCWPIDISAELFQSSADRLFLAVGNFVCSFRLPALEMEWATKIDMSHCIHLYLDQSHACLITNGELEVTRLDLEGNIIWSCSGADIFTNGFSVRADSVEVIDFNNDVYRIDIETGECEMLPGKAKSSYVFSNPADDQVIYPIYSYGKIWRKILSWFGIYG